MQTDGHETTEAAAPEAEADAHGGPLVLIGGIGLAIVAAFALLGTLSLGIALLWAGFS